MYKVQSSVTHMHIQYLLTTSLMKINDYCPYHAQKEREPTSQT